MKKISFYRSLRFQIILLVISLTMLATIITAVFYLRQIESLTVFELQHEGLLLSDLLESSISPTILEMDIKGTQAFIDRLVSIREKNDIEINVILVQGDQSAIVASNIPDNIEETSAEEHASLIASLKNDQPVVFIDKDIEDGNEEDEEDDDLNRLNPEHPDFYFPDGQRFLSITTPLIDLGNRRGSINIKMSLAVLDQKIKRIRQGIYAASVAEMLLLIVILGYFLNRRFLNPLYTMIENILRIGRSGIDRRLSAAERKDEFGLLAREFNRMMDRIQILITEMRDMSNDIAHDLKSPITRIRGTAEIALTSDSTMDDFTSLAASTIEECDTMLTIINTMLYIAAAEANALEVDFSDVNISDLVRRADEIFKPVAENREIRLNTVIKDECHVSGNCQMLQRVISNLLDNALKYTPFGGNVDIDVWASNKKVNIRIKDTGMGLAQEELPNIFNRFYRCDRSRSRPGSGLGLSLVHAILKLHKGEVTVSSTINQGSIFTVYLPLILRDEAK